MDNVNAALMSSDELAIVVNVDTSISTPKKAVSRAHVMLMAVKIYPAICTRDNANVNLALKVQHAIHVDKAFTDSHQMDANVSFINHTIFIISSSTKIFTRMQCL
jgi:hypothetical protein